MFGTVQSAESCSSTTCSASSGQSVLCERYSKLNLPRVLDLAYLQANSKTSAHTIRLVTSLGMSLDDWVDFRCPLCRLFYQIRPPRTSLQGSSQIAEKYHLYAVHPRLIFGHRENKYYSPQTTLLGILNSEIDEPFFDVSTCDSLRLSGLVCPVGKHSGQKVSPAVPFDLIQKWTSNCARYHGCTVLVPEERWSRTVPSTLLDCRSLELVPAPPTAIYVALSYVWGQMNSIRSFV
jgi:hypothetical protein